MKISQPSPVLAFPGTQVHAAVGPAAYTDLDLSAVVGARRAWVFLRLAKDGTAAADYVYVRRNGDAAAHDYISGTQAGRADASQALYLQCTTDAAGIVEWYTDDINPVWTITVEAYLAY